MHVVIFEGGRWHTFAPVALARPVFQLATGMGTLLEKQIRYLAPTRLTLWVRPELEAVTRLRIAPRLGVPTAVNAPLDDEPALIFSGRTLHLRKAEAPELETAIVDEGGLLRGAYVRRPGLSPADAMDRTEAWTSLLNLPQARPQARMVDYLWDLVQWNEESLVQDFATLTTASAPVPAGPFHVDDAAHVWFGRDVHLGPGVVIDSSKGPVMLGDHASVGANSVVQGPCYVAPYAQLMPHTLVRPGTTIGTMCKVGGEIANSIMFGYSNKAHYGYLGDSYVGKWVNLGAGTTTSNLKNTYGEITAAVAEGEVRSGQRFLGAMIGDHAKLGIGTRLMAGSYVGFGSMVSTSGIAPKRVPSFQFLTDAGAEPYRIEKLMEVVKAVFARRHRDLDPLDEPLVRYAAEAAAAAEAAG